MKKAPPLSRLVNLWVVGGGILLAILGIGAAYVALQMVREPPEAAALPTAVMTVVPAPTATPLVVMPTLAPTVTPTPSDVVVLPPENPSIVIGALVQIKGTGGDGLRLRAEPNTSSDPRFLGVETEVFEVKDGPREADGFAWWFLVAPMDPNRAGWAVSNYLELVQ
jgi:hypothetical protein